MNLTIPIYVVSYKPRGQTAPLFVCRAMLIDGPTTRDPHLNRAVNELVKQLKRQLDGLAGEPRHDDLLAATFCPDLDDHRLDLAFDLRSGWHRCRLSVVAFRALQRRIAFSPSLPDVWFEVPENEDLQTCANRVYERYFRQREREERDMAELLADVALKGLLSPQRLIAGMSYLGQWEQRLLAILKTARKRDHILYFDDLLGAYRAGVSRDSRLCVADVLKPYVERGEARVLAEMTPET